MSMMSFNKDMPWSFIASLPGGLNSDRLTPAKYTFITKYRHDSTC